MLSPEPRIWIPTLLLVLSASPASARQEPPDRWNVQLELGFNGASGNSSFSILRTGARAKRLQTDNVEFEVAGLLRYGRSDGREIANDQRVSLKLDLWPKARWSPFTFVDASRDIIRKLDFRSSGGAGIKRELWRGAEDSGDFSLSAALIWDYQDFRLAPGDTVPGRETLARWSLRAKGEKSISETTTLEHTTFYQPVWNRRMDYLLTMTTSVSTKVLAGISLSVEHEYLHDSAPPPEVRPDDQKFSVLLKLAL